MFRLDFIGIATKHYLRQQGAKKKIWKGKNLADFSGRIVYAIGLMFKEKEIILFALLQWAVIGMVYRLWVECIGWIPMEVWESEDEVASFLPQLLFGVWSLFCVALASYPIGILTGCMGAAHFLRQQGHRSTIAGCFSLALSNATNLWMFQTADSWWTVTAILRRLPKKNNRRNVVDHAVGEAMYYAWKVGTAGVLPALLSGRGLIDAGKSSVIFVRRKLWDVIKLRGGYSALCWIIGIVTYTGSFYVLFSLLPLLNSEHEFFNFCLLLLNTEHEFFNFCLFMGIPILVATGIINLFLRPIYVISCCKLYSDYLKEKQHTFTINHLPGKGICSFVAFLVLGYISLFAYMVLSQFELLPF